MALKGGGTVTEVKWSGLKELIQQLTDAPQDLREEGMVILREEVEGAAEELRAAYPTGATGNLKARVITDYPSSDLLVGFMRSASPHSHLYEFGTEPRKTSNNAYRGVMPKANLLVPIAIRRRERMFERLMDMMVRRGYQVSG